MPLHYRPISIDFSRGLNTKADRKTVTPGELILLENGIFSQPGTIQKRKGMPALGRTVLTNTTPKIDEGAALGVRGDDLVMIGARRAAAGTASGPSTSRVLSRDASGSGWSDAGTAGNVALSVTPIGLTTEYLAMPNGCIVDGKYEVFACEARAGADSAAADNARVVVLDKTTGSVHSEQIITGATVNTPKPLAIGTSALLFVAPAGGGAISVYQYSSLVPYAAFTLGPAMPADLNVEELWDACENDSASTVLAYMDTANTIKVKRVGGSGTIITTVTIAERPQYALGCFRVSDGTTSYLCVAYQQNGGSNIRFTLLNPTTLATVTAIATAFSTVAGAQPRNITGARETRPLGERIRIFCDGYDATGASSLVRSGIVTFAGAAEGFTTDFRHLWLAGKAFYGNQVANVLCVHGRTVAATDYVQPTYFLKSVDLRGLGTDMRATVAKVLYSRAPYNTAFSRTTGAARSGGLPQASSDGGSRWVYGGLRRERLLRVAAIQTPPRTSLGLCRIAFDLAPAIAPQTLSVAGELYMGGGLLSVYDGRWQEAGFHLFPYFTGASSATAGSLVASTAYGYRVVAQHVDRNGRIVYSSPTPDVTITTGVGKTSVDLTINTLGNVDESGWTTQLRKSDICKFHVYRTKAGATGPHYKTGAFVLNDPSVATVTVNDGAADSGFLDASGNPVSEILYTEGGVIENIGPPAMDSFAASRNRMAGIPSDDSTAVWYTKEKQAGIAYEWTDLLTFRIETHGPNVAIAALDDKWIVFKRTATYVVGGQGANDAGVGGYDVPYLLSGDIGCVDRASVLSTGLGVFFKSARGIYLLGGGGLKYIGAPVEAFNRYSIVSAVLEESAHRAIFFLSDHQPALVYDYEVGQWGTYTGHDAVSSAVWQGRLTFLGADGRVHHQTDDYLDADGGYALKIGVGWIPIAGPLGWERVRRLMLLATWKSAHILTGRVFYDYNEDVSHPLTFDATGDPGAYMLTARLPARKCTAIRFEIEDDGVAEGYSLSACTLEVGVRPGVMRLPASKTM